VKPGDVVVDLGSGSGVLAFFAIEAGARKVYAIERGHMADVIAMLAKRFDIEVLHEHSKNVEFPERANVLVTETLGAFALQEQILSSVIDARSRLVTPDATIIPHRIVLSAVPIELPREHRQHVGWWSEPHYGIDFSDLRMFAANQMFTKDITPANFLAPPAEIIDIDLKTIHDTTVIGNASFQITREGTLHGFGGWFTATLAEDITVSNQHESHWKQQYLPIERPLRVEPGMTITLELQSDDGKAWRWRGRDFDQTTWLASPPCFRGAD